MSDELDRWNMLYIFAFLTCNFVLVGRVGLITAYFCILLRSFLCNFLLVTVSSNAGSALHLLLQLCRWSVHLLVGTIHLFTDNYLLVESSVSKKLLENIFQVVIR